MNSELLRIIEHQKVDWEQKQAKNYVPRLKTNELQGRLNSNLIKVITGPRRAGKSVLATLALKGRRTAYLNFDEPFFARSVDIEDLLPALQAVYGPVDCYFFDEIQNLEAWQLWLNRLQREERNTIVSGSNANLLGGELATHLTGRYLATEILPFSFREFSSYHGRPDSAAWDTTLDLTLLMRFLQLGGYPEIVTTENDSSAYLSALVEAAISKDIVDRHNLRKRTELRAVAEWVFSNVAKVLTFDRLTAKDDGAELPRSSATTKKFFGYLQDAYLLTLLTRHNNSYRERIKSPKKAYAIDNGVALALGTRTAPDFGRLLENAVYLELAKAGKKLKYFRSTQGDKEVDFVVVDGHQVTQLFEAAWSLDDKRLLAKKLDNLAYAAKETRCTRATIVTWLDEKTVKSGDLTVNIVPFYKWAMEL